MPSGTPSVARATSSTPSPSRSTQQGGLEFAWTCVNPPSARSSSEPALTSTGWAGSDRIGRWRHSAIPSTGSKDGTSMHRLPPSATFRIWAPRQVAKMGRWAASAALMRRASNASRSGHSRASS